MNRAEWLAKRLLGTTLKEALHRPTQEQSLKQLRELVSSPIPPRVLGTSSKGGITTYSDNDRKDHFHILGAPDQGKSKLLEMMMSEDIMYLQNPKIPFKSGFCFLDSTANGATMRKVLKFCMKRNFKKVLVIDPHHVTKYGHVVNINPIDYSTPGEAIAGHIMDSVRVLWATKDPMDEAIIRKYLPKVFKALHAGGYTLPDADCFTLPVPSQYNQILSNPDLDFPTATVLTRTLTRQTDWRDFQSTCRRLDPFFDSTMKLMLGAKQGIDFKWLIRHGWVILVNLYPGGVFGREHSRLLGTLIINEIGRALERMTGEGYGIPYYVYIDEVGHYATRKLADMLDHQRHFGIRLTMAHQGFSQIEDPYVLTAIRRSAKNKVLFYTALRGDRYAMCQDMNYGGELPVEQVTYTLGSTAKQEAVVKIGKQPPVLTRMKDWPDTKVSNSEIDKFLLELFNTNPQLYRKKADVWGEITKRFEIQHDRPHAAESGEKVSPRPARSNRTAGSDNKRDSDKTPVVENAPVESGRQRGSVLSGIKREKGVLVRSYQNVHEMMNRYEDKPGYWKRIKHPGLGGDLWVFYEVRMRGLKEFEDQERLAQVRHNLGITSYYCAWYPHTDEETGEPVLTYFNREEIEEDYLDTYHDAGTRLYGVKGSYERECGEHPILSDKQVAKVKKTYYKKSMNFKMDRYASYLGKQKDRFIQIDVEHWIGSKFDRLGTDALFDQYLEFLKRYRFADHVLLARHRDVVGDRDHTEGEIHHDDLGRPTEDVWFCPAFPEAPISVKEFLKMSKWASNQISK